MWTTSSEYFGKASLNYQGEQVWGISSKNHTRIPAQVSRGRSCDEGGSHSCNDGAGTRTVTPSCPSCWVHCSVPWYKFLCVPPGHQAGATRFLVALSRREAVPELWQSSCHNQFHQSSSGTALRESWVNSSNQRRWFWGMNVWLMGLQHWYNCGRLFKVFHQSFCNLKYCSRWKMKGTQSCAHIEGNAKAANLKFANKSSLPQLICTFSFIF